MTALSRGPRGSISMPELLAPKRLSWLSHGPELTGRAPGQRNTAPETRLSGQRAPRTDRGGDVAEIDGTPLGQHLRGRGGHESDAMRARQRCHGQGCHGQGCHGHSASAMVPGEAGRITLPSAAITPALRGTPTARLATAPSAPSPTTAGGLVIPPRPATPDRPRR